MFKSMLIAGLGGFIGSSCRFLINKACAALYASSLPWATFIANMIGCFLFGIFIGILQKNSLLDSRLYSFLIVGFCGGLTTFSTFSNDLISLNNLSGVITPVVYAVISVAMGIVLLLIGKNIVIS